MSIQQLYGEFQSCNETDIYIYIYIYIYILLNIE